MLKKSRSVLKLQDEVDEFGLVTFAQDVDKGEDARYGLALVPELWEQFGSPDILTITVQPGDQLN